MDAVEVGYVVPVVSSRRRLERREPHDVDAETLQIVETAAEPFEVAVAVAVGVHERLDVEAVDDRVLVPEVADHEGREAPARRGQLVEARRLCMLDERGQHPHGFATSTVSPNPPTRAAGCSGCGAGR